MRNLKRAVAIGFATVMVLLVSMGFGSPLVGVMALAILALTAKATSAFAVRDGPERDDPECRRDRKHEQSKKYLSNFAPAAGCHFDGGLGRICRSSKNRNKRNSTTICSALRRFGGSLTSEIRSQFCAYRARDSNQHSIVRCDLHRRESPVEGYA